MPRRRVLIIALALALVAAIAMIGALYIRQATGDQMGWQSKLRHALGLGAMAMAGSAPAAAAPPPPTTIGINLIPPKVHLQSRSFANLAVGGPWFTLQTPGQPRKPVPKEWTDAVGNLRVVPEGTTVLRQLIKANTGPKGQLIRCTYAGRGDVRVSGAITVIAERDHEIRFNLVSSWTQPQRSTEIHIRSMDPADPVRDIDCREANMPREARFDPAFVRSLQGYAVLRFMDWQNTNVNAEVSWAGRHTPASLNVVDDDGVAVEDMVQLAREVGADPWFTVPWNADDAYVERFARYVHDHLPADRHVYVELGNEVWNPGFVVFKQSVREGTERALSSNATDAGTLRYAEKLGQVMSIWTRVFADSPRRLVRVAATQNGSVHRAELIFGFKDTARLIDAFATAPYFGYDVGRTVQVSTPDELFAQVDGLIDRALTSAEKSKAVAAQNGKRYIAYESGQHIVLTKDVPLNESIQRDPRMYDAYRRYIGEWRSRIGDLLTLYADVGPIYRWGAWGLSEHTGQSVDEAPKLRAVQDELKRR
jgi:hypothetical protein